LKKFLRTGDYSNNRLDFGVDPDPDATGIFKRNFSIAYMGNDESYLRLSGLGGGYYYYYYYLPTSTNHRWSGG